MGQKYSITTYSAKRFIQRYLVDTDGGFPYIRYGLNYSDQRELRRYVKSTDEYSDNALFYQIREIVDPDRKMEWGDNSLQKYLIFIDFENIFDDFKEELSQEEYMRTYTAEDLAAKIGIVSDEYRIRALFDNGIHISYSTDGGPCVVDYVPFDKSNSMSRQGKMSFVNAKILDELNERLNIGISFSNQTINLSKYYAYRGLYLSDAIRIDLPAEKINADTVIFVNDFKTERDGQNIITAEEVEEGSNRWAVQEKTNQTFKIEEVFDGEGIISFEYSDLINEIGGFIGASSYQVRMPFVKGMLHKVDFRRIIKDYLGEDVTSFIIKDIYGAERDLMKAEIIMPISMFKCKKWLKDEIDEAESEADKKKYLDFYFAKFYEYKHALYVSNTNLIYGKSALTKLNYQFLNTLDFTEEEFNGLVENHLYWAKNPYEYIKMMDLDQENAKNEEAGEEDDSEESFETEVWKQALEANSVFAHEEKIRGILNGISNGIKLDCARGKLVVNGEIRFLSRDLLAFVLVLIKENYMNLNAESEYEQWAPFLKFLDGECLFKDYFFMPQNRIHLEANKHYPFFRNPHLSRNEQSLLKPYVLGKEKAKKDKYYKYFGHLNGIVMVSYSSLVPQTMGGADFDGDIVKVVEDECVRKAVIRGIFENYKRKLPIIVIPGAEARADSILPKTTDYSVIKDTFSNNIGKISNLSVRLGVVEYGSEGVPEHSCAECTILTGLEIDAAKTGRHPNLSEMIEYAKGINLGFDYVGDFKEKVDELSQERFFLSSNQVKKEGNVYVLKKRKYDTENFIEYRLSDSLRNMDRLPQFFFDSFETKSDLPDSSYMKNGRYLYFDFLKDTAWKKKIDQNIKRKIAAIMQVYYDVEAFDGKVYKYRKTIDKKNYESFIRTILKAQYDVEDYEEIVDDELVQLFAYVDSAFETKESAEAVIELIAENRWPFLLENQKRDALINILEKTPGIDVESVLCNYDAQGYNILYYSLKDVALLRAKELSDEEIIAEFEDVNSEEQVDNGIDEATYREVFDEVYSKYIEWRGKKMRNWRGKAITICLKKINDLLASIPNRDEQIYLLYSLKGSKKPDRTAKFFWQLIKIEDIRAHMVKETDLENVR